MNRYVEYLYIYGWIYKYIDYALQLDGVSIEVDNDLSVNNKIIIKIK